MALLYDTAYHLDDTAFTIGLQESDAMKRFTGERAFHVLVFGQLLSLLGSGLTGFGMSIWILRETGSTLAFGVSLVVILLPIALGSFIAGPLVDRWDRRRMLIVADSALGVLTLILALLYQSDQIALWHVYLTSFLSGLALAFQIPAQQAVMPLLLPQDKLTRAAGISQLPGTVSEIVAPLLAGALIVSIGLFGIFLIDVITFVIGIVTVLLVHIPPLPPTNPTVSRPRFSDEFMAGFRYLWVQRPFFYLTGFITLTVFTFGVYQTLVPPLILRMSSEAMLGVTQSLIGVASLVGVVLLSTWKIRGRIRAIFVSALIMAGAGVSAALPVHLVWTMGSIALAFGVVPVLIGLNRALYQAKAPSELLGRIFAFRLAAGTTAQTLGALLAGLTAEAVFTPIIGIERSSNAALALFALIYLVGVGILLFIRPLRQLETRIPDRQQVPSLNN